MIPLYINTKHDCTLGVNSPCISKDWYLILDENSTCSCLISLCGIFCGYEWFFIHPPNDYKQSNGLDVLLIGDHISSNSKNKNNDIGRLLCAPKPGIYAW